MVYCFYVLINDPKTNSEKKVYIDDIVCGVLDMPNTLSELEKGLAEGRIAFKTHDVPEAFVKLLMEKDHTRDYELYQDFNRQKPQRMNINWVKETG